MRPLADFPSALAAQVVAVFTDIDDTLTVDGRLPSSAYDALWQLHEAGLAVVPVTGRPAGWCDHIARVWPVDAVVGENGALAYAYDRTRKKMRTWMAKDETERTDSRVALAKLRAEILAKVPGTAVASDQDFRLFDLAIDFCEDVEPLDSEAVAEIVHLFEAAGANAKVSSIHVNGWFGNYDKRSMTRKVAAEWLSLDLDDPSDNGKAVFVGDSPNDAPAFAYFRNSVGVANVRDRPIQTEPRYICPSRGGEGFAELASLLLEHRPAT